MSMDDHIAILMCTKNGAGHITEQLQSIVDQDHKNWSLWISDDASDDDTLTKIDAFSVSHPDIGITIQNGPNQGFCKNFFGLMANDAIKADYYALCDQDDIWLPNRLSRGLKALKQSGAALYGSRTIYIDEEDKVIGKSPLFERPPTLENAIVQSIAGGNTMLFTDEAMAHFRRASDVNVMNHDWWLYLYLTASGYKVYYDTEPSVLYRQHARNVIGSNVSIRAKYDRMKRLYHEEFKQWNALHIEALKSCEAYLSEHGIKLIKDWQELREMRGTDALKKLSEIALYRQTMAGELGLKVAAFIGKL